MSIETQVFRLHEYPALIDEALARSIDQETGEIIDEIWEQESKSLMLEKNITCLDIACAVKSHDAIADMLKAEENRLAERRKKHESISERYANAIKLVLKPSEKLSDGRASVSWRNNPGSVVVDCEASELPYEYVRVIPEKYEPDKKAIGLALRDGREIKNCYLRESKSVVIK